MSRKRKHVEATPKFLLSPSMFLSSIAKLNIVAVGATAHSTAVQLGKGNDGGGQGGDLVQVQSQVQGQVRGEQEEGEATERIEFTNEAIELLRRCHEQFIALLSSELASGERNSSSATNSSSKKTKRKSNDNVNKGGAGDAVEIRSILPQNIVEALDNLEFHDIASQIRLLMQKNNDEDGRNNVNNYCNGKKTNGKGDSGDAKVHDNQDASITTSGNNRRSTIRQSKDGKKSSSRANKRKMKAAWKNDEQTAELLKEQERLFALSVEKARLSKK